MDHLLHHSALKILLPSSQRPVYGLLRSDRSLLHLLSWLFLMLNLSSIIIIFPFQRLHRLFRIRLDFVLISAHERDHSLLVRLNMLFLYNIGHQMVTHCGLGVVLRTCSMMVLIQPFSVAAGKEEVVGAAFGLGLINLTLLTKFSKHATYFSTVLPLHVRHLLPALHHRMWRVRSLHTPGVPIFPHHQRFANSALIPLRTSRHGIYRLAILTFHRHDPAGDHHLHRESELLLPWTLLVPLDHHGTLLLGNQLIGPFDVLHILLFHYPWKTSFL
jgi:hypothetical protein